jgi:hypothetical protein
VTARSGTPRPHGLPSPAARALLPLRATARQVTDRQLRAVRIPQVPLTLSLSPTDDGGTEPLWRVTPATGLQGIGRLRRAALVTAVKELAAPLASAAEVAPTSRAEWTHVRTLALWPGRPAPVAATVGCLGTPTSTSISTCRADRPDAAPFRETA